MLIFEVEALGTDDDTDTCGDDLRSEEGGKEFPEEFEFVFELVLRQISEFEFLGAGLDDNLAKGVLRVVDEGISTTTAKASLFTLVTGLIEDCRVCFLFEEEDWNGEEEAGVEADRILDYYSNIMSG